MYSSYKILVMAVVALSLLSVSESFAAEGPLGKLSSDKNKHNLSFNANHDVVQPKASDPLVGGTTRICVFCHAPHASQAGTPLWNRPDPDASSFQLYAQPLAIKGDMGNADAATRTGYTDSGAVEYPNGASRLCMSCHDGITAIGARGNRATIPMLGGDELVNTVVDLTTSHPISFTYTQTIIDNDINPFRAGFYQMPDTSDAVDTPLDNLSRMQCTTCHDPHYDAQLDYPALPPFWRQTSTVFINRYTDVCNACHTDGTYSNNLPPQHNM
ncbi:MAG: hypothetical protein OET90_00085 [Desulfuromonadales bacterium]|nr:hypothetical protein [Desulfuromonadales bacterium]